MVTNTRSSEEQSSREEDTVIIHVVSLGSSTFAKTMESKKIALVTRPDGAIFVDVFSALSQDGHHGHVGFAGTGGSAEEHIFVRVEADFHQLALDPVEGLEPFKGSLGIGGQRLDGHQLFAVGECFWLESGDMHLFVALLLPPERPLGKLTPFVGHEVRTVGKGQFLQIEGFV